MRLKIKAKNYIPDSMSFTAGFYCNKTGDFIMYVDSKKSHQIINHLLSQGRKVQKGVLGLDGDFDFNHTVIYENGNFEDYDAHEGSQWAEPILLVIYEDGSNEAYSCWFRNVVITAVTSESLVESNCKQLPNYQ